MYTVTYPKLVLVTNHTWNPNPPMPVPTVKLDKVKICIDRGGTFCVRAAPLF